MRLTTALRAAELLTRVLPVRAQYALADLAGDAWYRFSPRRRRLVSRNLARVCAHAGSTPAPMELRLMVKQAFRDHVRYYLEILRVPRYPLSRASRIVDIPEWPAFDPIFRGGPVVLVTAHLGNFEIAGYWLASQGLHAVAPVEEIQPRDLFEFLLARRGGNRQGVEAIPLSKARHRLVAALRAGECAALVADRDVAGTGSTLSFFGHPTRMPTGPAALAVLTGARVVTGRSLRIGPDRFAVRGKLVEYETTTGDRSRDVTTLAEAIVRDLEEYISERPEQWFGAFEQNWPDISA